jgi:hypothetical protein
MTPFEVGKIDGAIDERRRIRAAQAKALRELRVLLGEVSWWSQSAEAGACVTAIESATRAPRRSTKKGTP